MPNFLDRVKENTATAGTGTVNLAGTAPSGFRTFASAGAASGSVYPYLIEDGSAWETGWGVWTDGAPDTFSRTLLVASSTGALLNLTGNATVAVAAHSASLAFMGAKATLSADNTAQDFNPSADVGWDAEEYDTHGFHDTVTNNERLTIPAGLGINKVRVTYTVRVNSVTADTYGQFSIQLNGATILATTFIESGNVSQGMSISWEGNVQAGDYFTARVFEESDQSVDLESDTSFFAIEVIG